MNTQLKKGILEMCVLYAIYECEMYGYDILKKMNKYFPDVTESTFYAILRRLNKEGSTEIYYGDVSHGPKRKYYRITDKGKVKLNDSINDWASMSDIISQIGIKEPI